MNIVIAGSKTVAIEISLALRTESEKQEKDLKISIVDSNREIMKGYSLIVRELIQKELSMNEFKDYIL